MRCACIARHFPTPASRKPILQFPRELPIAGEPADVSALIEQDHAALRASTYPKLLFYGEPGALISPDHATSFAASVHDCRLVPLGPGAHYLQEDHPVAIGQSVRAWLLDRVIASASVATAAAQADRDPGSARP
jgi:haloalkane dehalogenase